MADSEEVNWGGEDWWNDPRVVQLLNEQQIFKETCNSLIEERQQLRGILPIDIEGTIEDTLSPVEAAQKLQKEIARFRDDYSIFEELSPPDVSRKTFVKWCFDAWEREQNK